MHGEPYAFIHRTLSRFQLHRFRDFGLRRQIEKNLLFRAPQKKRAHPPGQKRAPFGIALFLNSHAKAAVETFLVAEKSGRDEGEQRPQLAQMVFERRTRETESLARLESTR